MTSIKSRAVTGTRSSPRAAKSAAHGLIRAGLLGSTALVAVGLAATGAMAQTYTPTGGGTIVVTGGGTTTDNTGAGGGFQNVGGVGMTITDVNITNTSGAPTATAINFTRSAFSGSGDGFTINGTNTLVAAAGGTGLTFVSTGGNNTGFSINGVLNVTGRNGLSLSTDGSFFQNGPATISLTAETPGQGTGLSMQSAGSIGDSSFTGEFNATNFQYGVDLTAGTGINFATGTGGLITGVQTGVRAVATTGNVALAIGSAVSASGTGISATSNGGAASVTASGAIVASGGIVATGTDGATATTSGTGTLNSTAAGVGTGITATSSGGTGAVTVNVGASIGDATAFAAGVSASTTGSSTGAINITTTAAIIATGRGISATAVTFGNTGTINIGDDVTGATGVYTNIGNYTVNVDAGATVTSTGSGFSNGAVYLINGSNTLINNGTLIASGAGAAGLHYSSSNGMATNTATGTITGSNGVYYQNNSSLTNAGRIIGTGTGASDAGIRSLGGTFNNTGSISGNTGLYNSGNLVTLNNTGAGASITGSERGIYYTGGGLTVINGGSIAGGTNDGITALGMLRLTNTGTLSSPSFSGVALVGGGWVTNSGTITGGNNATYGYGVQNASDAGTSTIITNQSGGLINGGTGSILLNGAGNTTIDLQAGSTTTGQILAQGGGTRNITVAGTLNGNYAGTAGTGTTTFTLATGGAMQSANFGTGTTTFNWTGGTIAGGVTTTDGSYQNLNVNLGAGGTGTIGGISRFFLNANSGTVTLTGSNVTSLKLLGGNIVVDTDLDTGGSTTASFQTTAGSTLTVNAGRSLISSTTGVNLSVAGTVTNAGTITGGQMAGINSNFYFYGVNNQAAGTVINNSGTIAVGEYNLVAAIQNSNNLQVNNTGLIRAGAVGSTLTTDGIRSYGGTLTVANSTAGSIIAGGEAGILTTGGTLALTNAGYVVGTTRAINAAGAVNITNSGTIGNGQVTDMGVYAAGGTGYAISTHGGTITNSGTIRGASAGIYSSNGLTLTNTGTISGGEGDVVLFRDGVTVLNAPSTILNAGTISSQAYSALLIQGGTIINAAAGLLIGGTDTIAGVAVQFSATGGTFTNYGSATGAGAGAVRVNTPGAATTINLHAGSTTGAILLNSGNDAVAIYNGRGTDSLATLDGASGITLQVAGTVAAASFGAIDMGSGTNTLVLAGTGDGTAANGAAGTMANGTVGGVTNLSKIDSGLWTLTGTAGYAGTTTVAAGTLRVLNTGSGLGDGAVSIAAGATLNFDNQTGLAYGLKASTYTGAGHLVFTSAPGGYYFLGNSGAVVVGLSQGGLIDIQSGSVSGSASGQGIWTTNMASLNIASGARFDTVEGLVRVDALTGAGSLTGGFGGTVPITVGVAGGSGTFSGVISNNTSFGGRFLALTKVGAGTQTLSGVNTYTGTTTISGGTLALSGTGAIANSASVANNGIFDISGVTTDVAVRNLGGSGGVVLGANTLTINNSADTTMAGVVSGSGGLLKSGAATLTLSGTNTYTGTTLIQGGTIELRGGAAIADTGLVSIAAGSTLAVSTSETIGNLTGAGATTLGGVLTLAAGSGVYGGNVSGGGTLALASGNLTLDGTLTQAGGLVLGSGTSGTISATGSITTVSHTAVTMFDGSLLTNRGGLTGSANGVYSSGGTISVVNNGSIVGTNNAGVLAQGALTLINEAGGTISGRAGVFVTGVGTVTNATGAAITVGSLNNAVRLAGDGSSLTNAGTISASTDFAGVYFDRVGAVINQAGGIISNTGPLGSVVEFGGSGSALTNAGTISGASSFGGVYFAGTGTVTNQTGGTISNSATAIQFTGVGSVLDNAGFIANINASPTVYFVNSGTVTNRAGGTISAINGGPAILLKGAGHTVDLQSGSTVNGLINASATTGLNIVNLTGTLNGGYSGGAGTDIVTLDADARVSGLIYGSGGVDTLVLAGLADGSLDIGQTLDFESRTLTGAGVWTLSGTDNDPADWTLDSGTLRLTGSQSVSNSAGVLVNAGATLSIADSEAIGALNGAGAVAIDAGQTLFVGVNDSNSRFSGIISGAGGLSQSGTGNLTLSGANTYTGDTRVDAGTLRLGASGVIADSSGLIVVSGATLDMQGHDETVAVAYLNGTLDSTVSVASPGIDEPQVLPALTQSNKVEKGGDGRLTIPAPTETGTLTAAEYQLNGATVNANLGTGMLFNTGGVSILNGTAGAGTVSVQAGTLRLGASDRLADTATVSVSSGAIFDVNGRTETIGALYGTGAIAIGAGRLTLGGADSAFGGSLSGTGSLVHSGGLFTLAGSHSLQTISNTGGELRFLGTTTGGVAVSGGSLTGAGTIGGALTVSGGATLSPGVVGQAGSIGRFSATSLSLNGGTLSLGLLGTAGGNLSDTLVISGTANLTGGLIAPTFLAPAGGYDFVTRYTFLTAGTLVGTFSNGDRFAAATGQTGMYWRVVYDQTPNAAVLELRKLIDFTLGAGGSSNQNAVGRALSSGQLEASADWATVLDLLSGLNGAQQQAAFDSLGGEVLADVSTSLFAANDAFLGAVRDGGATRTPGSAPLSFASAFRFVGGQDGTAAMVTGVLDAFDPSAGVGTGRGGWISVHASDIDLEGKTGQADLQTRLSGFVGGYTVGSGDYVLGAAAGATRVEGDVVGRQSSFESDLIHAAGYVRFDDGRWAAEVTASAYGGEIDSRRTVTVGAFTGQALGKTHGEGQSLSASVARRFADDSGGAVSIGLMQTLSRGTVDSFTERAAGALSLEVADQERNWQTTQLNLRGTQDYRLSGQPMRLYGGIGVLVTTGDREASADMRFSGAGASFGGFTIEGAEAPPLAGVTEFGLEYEPREGLILSTGYRAVFSDRLNDNQVGARMAIQW